MRFVTPALFACAALYVGWFNGTHEGRALVLPFLEVLVPSSAGDPAAQGALTVQALGALAGVFAVWDTITFVRARAARGDER